MKLPLMHCGGVLALLLERLGAHRRPVSSGRNGKHIVSCSKSLPPMLYWEIWQGI
jgi:hypothetical protein